MTKPALQAKPANDLTLYIRPEVGMYGAFARLNYKPWFALAEFVDNALQSYIANRPAIKKEDGSRPFTVRISIESDRIVVSDTAAGIAEPDLPRAFSPARPPPDASGLSEFGLGMKAAACWFANRWHVRTKALGDDVERTVDFDVPNVVANGVEHLTVKTRPVPAKQHYTTIVLEELNVRPQKRTLGKIKKHLGSIYRCYLQGNDFELYVDGEKIEYEEPAILKAPYHREKGKSARDVEWKKEINIALDDTHKIWGWAALREKASVSEAGFAVFRRNRLIMGSHDDPYRPDEIFGRANSFTYQRLFGELHVEGFKVTHTKDGINWGDLEEPMLDRLERALESAPLPLLDQAEGHRKGKARALPKHFGEAAVQQTVNALAENGPHIIGAQLGEKPEQRPVPGALPERSVRAAQSVEFELNHRQRTWAVSIELVADESDEDWYTFSRAEAKGRKSGIKIRLNLAHPFSERFALAREDEDDLKPHLRIATALSIAEITALESGVPVSARTIRRNFNKLLRDALSEG